MICQYYLTLLSTKTQQLEPKRKYFARSDGKLVYNWALTFAIPVVFLWEFSLKKLERVFYGLTGTYWLVIKQKPNVTHLHHHCQNDRTKNHWLAAGNERYWTGTLLELWKATCLWKDSTESADSVLSETFQPVRNRSLTSTCQSKLLIKQSMLGYS